MGIFQGKVAVITGGTRGLGKAIAKAYAAEGAALVVASRSRQSVENAVAELHQIGAKATGLAADVGVIDQVDALAGHAMTVFGRLDIWINNAGLAGPYGPTIGLTPQAFTEVVQTNILGVYHGSLSALKHMLPQGSGKLINVLGHGYKGPVPYQNAYAASKAWVRSFTMSLAKETKASGVGVYAFNPGMVVTDLLTDVEVIRGSEDRLKSFPTVIKLLGRQPEIPAGKAVWLASSATDGKTGLLVSVSNPLNTAGIALYRMLTRVSPPEIQVRVIPPSG
jgi:NAD(P)-dependent dehydrogenase (short-subunit alcohol dehydrogenase family)